MKYCPVGYIACVEGYFRLLVADLINLGEQYRARIVEFKDIKFGSDCVLAIHDRKVTLGDFVADFLPMNRVSDINHAMSTLIGQDFLSVWKALPSHHRNPISLGQLFPRAIAE